MRWDFDTFKNSHTSRSVIGVSFGKANNQQGQTSEKSIAPAHWVQIH
jgi:hypothetical protein